MVKINSVKERGQTAIIGIILAIIILIVGALVYRSYKQTGNIIPTTPYSSPSSTTSNSQSLNSGNSALDQDDAAINADLNAADSSINSANSAESEQNPDLSI